MHLPYSSIQQINQMLLERVSILNLQAEKILCLDEYDLLAALFSPERTQIAKAPFTSLPFENERFDLILFHLDGQLLDPLEQTLKEFKRVLKVQGILLFATKGLEMHDLGDALLKTGFADPVTDNEHFEIEMTFGYAWRKPESSYRLENGDVIIPILKTKA
ncbi:MAG: methyltransferase domain-containing protein [Gammaproteobacteria bacterium]|nr:methyltransferase domain-containing protein [Gammaproteobacteria bacterium]